MNVEHHGNKLATESESTARKSVTLLRPPTKPSDEVQLNTRRKTNLLGSAHHAQRAKGGISALLVGMGVSSATLTKTKAKRDSCKDDTLATITDVAQYEACPGMEELHKISLEVEDVTRKIEQCKCEQQQIKEKYAAVERDLSCRRKEMSKVALKTEGYQRLHRLKSVQVEDMEIKVNSATHRLNRSYQRNRKFRDEINEYRMKAMLNCVAYDESKAEVESCELKRGVLEEKVDTEQTRALDEMDEVRQNQCALRNDIRKEKERYESLHEELHLDNERARLGKYEGDISQGRSSRSKVKRNPLRNETDEQDNSAKETAHPFDRFRLGKRKTTIDLHQHNSPLFSRAAEVFNKGNREVRAGDLTVEEETGLRMAISTGKWMMQKGKNTLTELEKQVESYEMAFKYIQKETGVKTTDELVQNFVNQEEENFRMFTTVNDLSAEIETLEMEIEQQQLEFEKFTGKEEEGDNGQSVVKGLERKEEYLTQKMARDATHIAQLTMVLDSIKEGITSLFLNIGCDPSIVDDLIQASTDSGKAKTTVSSLITPATKVAEVKQQDQAVPGTANASGEPEAPSINVDEASILQYLGLIEARVSELIIRYSVMAVREGNFDEAEVETLSSGTSARRHTRSKKTKSAFIIDKQAKVKVAPRMLPSADTISWSDDEDDNPVLYPMSHAELLQKVEAHTTASVTAPTNNSILPQGSKRRGSRSTVYSRSERKKSQMKAYRETIKLSQESS